MSAAPRMEVVAVAWPEVSAGDNLAALLIGSTSLASGDIVVVTSKVVSKAEGRLERSDRRDVIDDEAVRVLARRGETVIAETRHGLVLAAAGVDASNTPAGTTLRLPVDPDESARRLRAAVYAETGLNVAVLVSDTAGRAWRNGQVDIAIGCAGVHALTDLAGTSDAHGNVLSVTAPARADELAAATELVRGKTRGCPVAVVRGLAASVLPVAEDGAGAVELVRAASEDMFGLGAREAVVAAARRDDPVALTHFPRPLPLDAHPFADVGTDDDSVRVDVRPGADVPARWAVRIDVRQGSPAATLLAVGRLWERLAVLAAAHRLTEAGGTVVALPPSSQDGTPAPGWHTVVTTYWTVA